MIGDGNFISQVPLFGGLDDAQQVSLQQKMGHTTLRRGETLFDEGDLGDRLYIHQRRASFLIDYNVSENSKGFHAPAYQISLLNQATDWSRRGQLALHGVDVGPASGPLPGASPSPSGTR